MFVSLAIHRPKAGAEAGLIDAMLRFDAAARGAPGLREIHTLRASDGETLVGLALWDDEAAFHAAQPAMRAAIAGINVTLLEDAGPDFYLLTDVSPATPTCDDATA